MRRAARSTTGGLLGRAGPVLRVPGISTSRTTCSRRSCIRCVARFILSFAFARGLTQLHLPRLRPSDRSRAGRSCGRSRRAPCRCSVMVLFSAIWVLMCAFRAPRRLCRRRAGAEDRGLSDGIQSLPRRDHGGRHPERHLLAVLRGYLAGDADRDPARRSFSPARRFVAFFGSLVAAYGDDHARRDSGGPLRAGDGRHATDAAAYSVWLVTTIVISFPALLRAAALAL